MMFEVIKGGFNFFLEAEACSLLARLKDFLAQRGIKSYLVGGYVRDGLLGRVSSDIDLAVAKEAMGIISQVADAFGGKYVVMDEVNEVARVALPQEAGRWHLDFSAMRGSIEEDLARRDFTINAIALDLDEIRGTEPIVRVVDPFGGCHDLDQGSLRVVEEAVFERDPVRLLRAVRLAAELGFALESKTEALIRRDYYLVTRAASERIQEELCHLLAAPKADRSLRRLDQLGLLTAIIPELSATKLVKQPKEHFWDVFEHSVETVAAIECLLRLSSEKEELVALVPWSPTLAAHFEQEVGGGRSRGTILKLAGLLHDLGKPLTKTIEQTGRIRFLGHAKEGAAMAEGILERLRFSTREVRMVHKMVEQHLRPGQLSKEGMPSHRAIYRYFRDTGEVGIDTLFLNLADYIAARGPLLGQEEWQGYAGKIEYVLSKYFEEQSVVTPPKLVNGHDLMANFGMSPGPRIGQLLEAVREAQAAGEITTREEALAFVKRQLGID